MEKETRIRTVEYDLQSIGVPLLTERFIAGVLMTCAFALLSFYDLTEDGPRTAVLIWSIFICSLQYVGRIYERNGRQGRLTLRNLVYLLSFVTVIIFYRHLITGMSNALNGLIHIWNLRYDDCLLTLHAPETSVRTQFIFWCFLILCVSIIFEVNIAGRRFITVTLSALFCIVLSAAFGISCHGGVILLMLLGLCLAWPSMEKGHQVQLQNVLAFVIMSVLTLGAALIGGFALRTDRIPAIRETIRETVERVRFGSDTLPHGDLSKAGSIRDDREERLVLQTDSRLNRLYLRGYTGSEYTGLGWRETDKIRYTGEEEGILTWLGEEGLHPVRQFAVLAQTSRDNGAASDAFGDDYTLHVDNISADRRYIYAPVGTIGIEGTGSEEYMDWNIRSDRLFGSTEYDIRAVGSEYHTEELSFDASQTKMATPEQVYRGFVYENYTDISDEMKELINEVFFDETWTEGAVSMFTLTSRIRTILDMKEVFTEEVKFTPGAKDAVRDFLENTHAGNDALFASAAVMAYRAKGYPARYAEGYFIRGEEGGEAGADISVTSQQAHAWAEVYVDYAGWMPVELTPGYYSEEESGAEVINVPIGREGDQAGRQVPVPVPVNEETEDVKEAPEVSAVPTVSRVLHNIVLILYVLVGIWLLLELQRLIRKRIATRKMETGADDDFRRQCCDRIALLAGFYGEKLDLSRPEQARSAFLKAYPGIVPFEYDKAIRLIQKSVFGGGKFSAADRRILTAFTEHLEECAHEQAHGVPGLIHRYRYAL